MDANTQAIQEFRRQADQNSRLLDSDTEQLRETQLMKEVRAISYSALKGDKPKARCIHRGGGWFYGVVFE